MRQNAELLNVESVTWRLVADEAKMDEAENAVLADYANHLSQLDWTPFDEDDERPDHCDRYIEWYPGDTGDKFARAMLVASHLGSAGRIEVRLRAHAFSAILNSETKQLTDGYLHIARVAKELQARITRACHLLQGVDASVPRDYLEQP